MAVHGEEPEQLRLLINFVLGTAFARMGVRALMNGYFDLGARKITRYYRGERPMVFWLLVTGCLLVPLICVANLSRILN